ncbi:MAG: adenylyltransferase/cytidyltransferase family protein, partial [Sulfolobales archaeon]|nr:adenylyltransferase/cytidyltransferase family protein [Sulfolobales archaeon]MDW8011135.1 adenylyltransferase/cytidyltransferase family protein [Sulfolobales archaeon]
VAGTFDLLHPGHVYFLNRAYELGLPYVVVSRDVNVIRSKGRPPVMSELDRLTMVSSLKPVYKAVLGDTEDYLKPVVEIHPDVILLGPDQFVDENQLTRELESRGLRSTRVLRVKERLDNYSSTQLIKRAREVLNNSIK